MPSKPKRACRHPGCPALVAVGTGGYCSKHAPLHPKIEMRPTAAKRGYGAAWQKARKAYLEAHPLCVECLKHGRYVRATDVDHIIAHLGDQKLFWDRNNWQALCHSCHSKKTNLLDHYQVHEYKGKKDGR